MTKEFKPGERVLIRGWPAVGNFIAIIEKRSCSGSSYCVRSESPLFRTRTHIKGEIKLRTYTGYISKDDVLPLTLMDELALMDKEPVGP